MQNHHHQIDHDQKGSLTTASKPTSIKSMDHTQQQQQQPPLKCPRCDSSNTKFCYYNNYSLSQPRHFCKACKRYWTRGGTLRNVPVGGGCRKNRRVRRPSSSSSSSLLDLPSNPSSRPDGPSSSNGISPLFYGLSSGGGASEINLPVPSFLNPQLALSGYDHLHPSPFSALGLGFSAPSSHISDSLLSSYGMFGSPSSSNNGLQHQRIVSMNGLRENPGNQMNGHFQSLPPLGGNIKEPRAEQVRNLQMEWNNNGNVPSHCQNQIERTGGDPHPTLYWNNNAATAGGWSDLPKEY